MKYFTMHAVNPQPHLIKQVAQLLTEGKLIVYPTDSTYALGCRLDSHQAVTMMRQIRQLKEKHPLSLLCCSISQAAQYALLDDRAFQYFKEHTPGHYTFILPATKKVPRLAQGIKRKVVGIRIPDHPIPLALVEALGEPLLSTTLWLPGEDSPINDPQEAKEKIKGQVDVILDGGLTSGEETTVLDLAGDSPILLRGTQED